METEARTQAIETLKSLNSFVHSECFKDFFTLYHQKTGLFLKTIEQLIDAIANKTITPQDLFEERFNGFEFSEQEEDYWLNNLSLFDYDVYFPPLEKQAQSGVWIKVRNKNGYQVHFAKKASRKIRFIDNTVELLREFNEFLSKLDTVDNPGCEAKSDAILKSEVRRKIGLQPYELWYWRTKTQKAYDTPSEYEVVDVQELIESVQDKSLKGIVSTRSLFTSQNKDKIYYLRSRGVSENVAKIMANLNQCYFVVNIAEGMEQLNQQAIDSFSSQLSL